MRTFPSWCHQELINWSRWCWEGETPVPIPQSTCASYEKHYRPTEWESDPDDRGRTYVNQEMARHVDIIWRSLPTTSRLIIRAAYPQRHLYESNSEACKAVGIKIHQWEDELNRAAWMIADKLGAKTISRHYNREAA